MPELTYSEALAKLSAMTDPTIEQLRDLVARTSVAQIDLVPTRATILYSGPLTQNFHGDSNAFGTSNIAAAENDK